MGKSNYERNREGRSLHLLKYISDVSSALMVKTVSFNLNELGEKLHNNPKNLLVLFEYLKSHKQLLRLEKKKIENVWYVTVTFS